MSFQNEAAQKYLDMGWSLSKPREEFTKRASRSRSEGSRDSQGKMCFVAHSHLCSADGQAAVLCAFPGLQWSDSSAPPSMILNIVRDDYQMILHASLCSNMRTTVSPKGKPKAALERNGSLGS